MRLLMLTPALVLCLAACGKADDTEAQNAGRALTAETISSNDVTAIDAVTGEAANMAEDVDFTLELNNTADGANRVGNGSAARRRPQSGAQPQALPGTLRRLFRSPRHLPNPKPTPNNQAYRVGSSIPASAKPFERSRHASQRPQWRPSGSGS